MPLHPTANWFPMMEHATLFLLAEDIRQFGLVEPLVVDTQGRIP